MGATGLAAYQDLQRIARGDLLNGITLSALLTTGPAAGYDVPAWRSLSNLLQDRWQESGLPSSRSWWAPRRSDARALVGARRDLSVGSANNGGALAMASAVTAVAAAVRPMLVLDRIGCQRLEVGSVVDAVVPEWSGGSGYWVGEGGAVGSADVTVSTGTALPHTAGCSQVYSRRLLKNAADLEPQLAAELQRLVRGTLEAGLIAGDGSQGQPLGLIHTTGATAVSFAGAVPTFAEVADVLQGYYDNDGDPDAAVVLVNPVTFVGMLETQKVAGSGQYLAAVEGQRRSVLGVTAQLSNHVPEGKVVMLDPANVTLVFWRAASVSIDPNSTTGNRRMVVLNDVDLVVRHRSQLVIGG